MITMVWKRCMRAGASKMRAASVQEDRVDLWSIKCERMLDMSSMGSLSIGNALSSKDGDDNDVAVGLLSACGAEACRGNAGMVLAMFGFCRKQRLTDRMRIDLGNDVCDDLVVVLGRVERGASASNCAS